MMKLSFSCYKLTHETLIEQYLAQEQVILVETTQNSLHVKFQRFHILSKTMKNLFQTPDLKQPMTY